MQFHKNILVYFAMKTASDYDGDGTKLSQAGSKTAAGKKKKNHSWLGSWQRGSASARSQRGAAVSHQVHQVRGDDRSLHNHRKAPLEGTIFVI